ncbi:MAG: 50S ribosomal protein L28 [Patescibacteria group bacterium]
MSRLCDMCGKGALKGNLVSFSNKKSIKKSQPNLRSVRISIKGVSGRIKICASCLSKVKSVRRQEAAKAVTA